MKKSTGWFLIGALVLAGCGSATSAASGGGGGGAASLSPSKAVWAASRISGTTGGCLFAGAAVDASGHSYIAGFAQGSSTYGFSATSSLTATGATNAIHSPVLAKYNADGTVAWAKTRDSGTVNSKFRGVRVDPAGAVYAFGYLQGTGTDTFGTVSVTGTSVDYNPAIYKFSAAGTPLWSARATTGGGGLFYGGAIGPGGVVYGVGEVLDSAEVTFGTQKVTGSSYWGNPVLVQYNSTGAAQWAVTWTGVTVDGLFTAAATDAGGNVYAVGQAEGGGTLDFGNQVTLQPPYTGYNAIVVKFNSSGVAQWARTTTVAGDESAFLSVAVTTSGVYAAGRIKGTGTLTFGPTASATGTGTAYNPVLVKYGLDGTPLWAQTRVSGAGNSQFNGVAADPEGQVFCAGETDTAASLSFGTGTLAGTSPGINPVLVKYSAAGAAQWARTPTDGGSDATYLGVDVNAAGQMTVAGEIDGTYQYTFGTGVSVAGTATYNPVVVGFQP